MNPPPRWPFHDPADALDARDAGPAAMRALLDELAA